MEAFEGNAQKPAHGTAPAVRADQEIALEGPRSFGRLRDHLHIVRADAHFHDVVRNAPLRAGDAHQLPVTPARELVLFAVNAVRMARVVLQHAEVEFGDQALLAIAVLHQRKNQPLGHQLRRGAAFLQQLQGRRMPGGSAVFRAQLRVPLEHHDRDAGARQ